jgi:ribosome assembly protein SQT1
LQVTLAPLTVANSHQTVKNISFPSNHFFLLKKNSLPQNKIKLLGKRIISACANGHLIFWDPRSSTPIFKLTPDNTRFDLDGITSIAINPSSTLAVVGGAAGGLRVIGLTKGDIVSSLLGGHTEGESIESIVFVDIIISGGSNNTTTGPGVVVTGATDGKACIWDLTTMRLRVTLEHRVS